MLGCANRCSAELYAEPSAALPGAPSLRVEPPTGIRDLRAAVSPPLTPVRWEVDGEDAAVRGLVVPARRLVPGQRWEAIAEAGGTELRATVVVPEPPGGNVLVLLLDDIGVDQVGAYGLGADPPPTPTLDHLAETGARFDLAYASPVCSPARAELLTGRHARRTGLGWIVDTGDEDYALPLPAVTVAEALDAAAGGAWATSAVGKWHLAPRHWSGDWLTHPLDQGFDWYAGSIGNPGYQPGRGYWSWDKDVNGAIVPSETYMTTETVNDAIARVAAMPEPWFLYVAFNAAHTPLSPPPRELVTIEVDPTSPERALYDATVEALDAEIGRLLAAIDPAVLARTTILTLGDNGTSPEGVDPPLDPHRAKETPYELGIRVPFLVNGPLVSAPGSVSEALVHVSDVAPTVAEIAGVPLGGPDEALYLDLASGRVELDGRSLVPLLRDPRGRGHALLYTEGFFPNGPTDWSIDRQTLRDERYKLVRRLDGPDQLFDVGNPRRITDGPDLLDGRADSTVREAARRLAAELECLEDELVYEGR